MSRGAMFELVQVLRAVVLVLWVLPDSQESRAESEVTIHLQYVAYFVPMPDINTESVRCFQCG